MDNEILNIYKNNDILNFSQNLYQIKNNITNNKIEKNIDISINKINNINSDIFIDDNILYNKINNSLFIDEKDNLFPNYVGENTIIDNFLNMNTYNNIVNKQIIYYEDMIIDNNIFIKLNKQYDFIATLKDIYNNNGTINILLNDKVLYKNIIKKSLYNKDIYNYIKNSNIEIKYNLENNNNIPLEIIDNDLYIQNEYTLDMFVIRIKDYSNILNNIISKYSNNYILSSKMNTYKLKFEILLEIDKNEKFPIKFGHKFNEVKNYKSKLLNNKLYYEIILNKVPLSIDLESNIKSKKYKNFYLVFL